MAHASLALVVVMASGLLAAPALALEPVSHGRFERVPVLLPDGPVQRVVVWFAGEGDAAPRQARLQALRRDGALVVDVDTRHLAGVLAKEGGSCGFSAGDVENFSRYVQAYLRVPTGVAIGVLFLGERPALAHGIAFACAVGGILLTTKPSTRG